MMRMQISVDKALYQKAKAAARRQRISLAELCRRGLEEVVAREPSSKPWMAFAGRLAGNANDSTTIDEVVWSNTRSHTSEPPTTTWE